MFYLGNRKGLFAEKIKTHKNMAPPELSFNREKIYLNFSGHSVLAQEKVTYTHGSIVNLYIVYLISTNSSTTANNDYLD